MRTFTLQKAGGIETAAADLNLELCSMTRKNQAPDTVLLSFIKEQLADVLPFAFAEVITLRANDVIIYTGRVATIMTSADAPSIALGYELRSAWWSFERTIYTQDWPSNAGSPRVMLGATPAGDGTYSYNPDDDPTKHWDTLTTAQQIIHLANFFGSGEVNVLAAFTGQTFWPHEAISQNLAELMKEVLKWHPFCATRMDYGDLPLLTIVQRDDGSAPMPKLTILNGPGYGQWKKASVSPKQDGAITFIKVNFVETFNGVSKQMDSQTAGTFGTISNQLVTEITLTAGQQWRTASNMTLDNKALTGSAVLYPAGVASWLLQQLSPTVWSGTFETMWDLDGGVPQNFLGTAINLAGGEDSWLHMDAVVQTQVDDYRTGISTITFGAQSHLGLTDWLGQVRGKLTKPVKAQAQRDNPGSATTDTGPAGALLLTKVKPAWYTGDIPNGGGLWITMGVGGAAGRYFPPDNITEAFNLATNTYVFSEIALVSSGAFRCTGHTIKLSPSATGFQTDQYDPTSGNRPAKFYVPLGFVDGKGNVINYGTGGNIVVREVLNNITKTDGNATKLTKTLTHNRKG